MHSGKTKGWASAPTGLRQASLSGANAHPNLEVLCRPKACQNPFAGNLQTFSGLSLPPLAVPGRRLP